MDMRRFGHGLGVAVVAIVAAIAVAAVVYAGWFLLMWLLWQSQP